MYVQFYTGGKPRLELGVQRLWNYVELFWNSLDNAPSSIAFYLEMKVEVELGVHNIRSRLTPQVYLSWNDQWALDTTLSVQLVTLQTNDKLRAHRPFIYTHNLCVCLEW